jgi:hypothetical protein
VIPLSALWLPILVSAVAVFIVSSIIHMVSPWHKGDYPKLDNEDALADAVRPLNLPPGDYMVPRPRGTADMKSDTFKEKVNRGPNLILTVIPNGPRSMGTYLFGWFIYILVVTIIAAHIGGALAGAGDRHFGIHGVGIIAFIGYTVALWQMSIWYHRKWSTTIKATVDGLIYAVVTFLVFASFWPK